MVVNYLPAELPGIRLRTRGSRLMMMMAQFLQLTANERCAYGEQRQGKIQAKRGSQEKGRATKDKERSIRTKNETRI